MKARSLAATILAAAATLLAGDARAAGRVTAINVTAAPASHTGACPMTITFPAKVTMNGPGSVIYKWERSDGATDTLSHPAIVFPAAGTREVTTTWTLGAAIPTFQPFNGWQKLQILRPNKMTSESGKFVLDCQNRLNNPPGGRPDLVPQLHTPMDGFVAVKNIGIGPAGPSRLLLTCQKLPATGVAGGGCPMPTAPLAAPWSSGPGRFWLDVPILAPGAVFSSTVPAWESLAFTPGTYQFTAIADFFTVVAESNEGNNTTMSSLTK
jgi:hypothetical protein